MLVPLLALAPALAQEPAEQPDAGTTAAEAPAEPKSTRYAVAPSSTLGVVIRNDTGAMLSRLGHDHVIVADKASGEITWPSGPGAPCAARIQVPVKSLVVDPPGAREREGLDDNTISDSDKQKLSANMWGKSQLDADNHPHVTFEVPSCEGGTGTVRVKGDLTIRGVTKRIDVPLNVTISGDELRATAKFTTTHTAHGFDPFRATPMGPRNADLLAFTIDLRAKATP